MPIFNVQILQRVTRHNPDTHEATTVDRIVSTLNNVVAVDEVGAAAAAGREVFVSYDKELFSAAMVRVQKVSA